MACDSSGNIYGSGGNGSGGEAVIKLSPNGDKSVFLDVGNDEPRDLAFDTQAISIWRFADSIEKFTPDGVGSVFANFHAINLAISPVPEPSTLALAVSALVMALLTGLRGLRKVATV